MLRVAGLLLTIATGVRAQVVDTTLWSFSPGGNVLAIAPAGDTIYLGGSFRSVGPPTGSGVPVDTRTAAPLSRYPRVVGRVYSVVADGEGGWYLGGDFSFVGTHPRRNLAHTNADGTVSPWAPDPDGIVRILALAGSTLYVGGDFDTIGLQRRVRLAALSTTSAEPLSWRCDVDGRVTTLLVNGPTLYVGGWFLNIGGQPRTRVAAVEALTGSTLPWRVDLNSDVSALAIRDTTLYIGGYFYEANGHSRQSLVAVGSETGVLHAWDPGLTRVPWVTNDGGAHVNALLVSGNSLFVGGSFSHLGGQLRRGLAQLDLETALPTAWNPRANMPTAYGPLFYSLELSGDTLFVAGVFDSLAGAPGNVVGNTAALSAATAERFAWDPKPNDTVFALALQGGVLFIGGRYTSVGDWVLRRGLAAIDLKTGRVTDWDPQPNDYIESVLYHGGKVYVGGFFSSVGGQPRSHIAALDPVTGKATSWNPGANLSVWALHPMGDAVLAGGLFTNIGGTTQRYLAAIDTSTGQLTAWRPSAVGEVFAIAVSDSAIYVGGDFTSMGGQPRANLAALDPVTALATSWNPGADGRIEAISVHSGGVYVGGRFDQVGGLPRSQLAAIDFMGGVMPWAPNATGPFSSTMIHALAAGDSTVYVGGYFSRISGEATEYFAALDATTGAIRTSFPAIDGVVWSLAAQGGDVYVGGGFRSAGIWPQCSFVAIRPARSPAPPEPPEQPLVVCTPNPVRTVASVRYTLPGPVPVSLTVFDLQGRAVERVLTRAWQPAGPQQVPLSTGAWQPGCYLLRFEAGRLSSTRKIVVLR